MNAASTASLAAAILALAACQQPSAPVAEDDAPVTPAATASPSPEEAKEVTLAPDGIALVNAVEGRGTATELSFGMPRENVLAAMAVDFGAPEASSNEECGAGPMEFAGFGALQLNFLDGKLAGWLAEPAANLVTADGTRPGAPLSDLQARHAVEMADSTLEGEFGYETPDGGTIGGFVDREGRITALNAGVNCFFR
ncbi:hypothetical protein [Pelagerythrobacter sp.]|uniref:hypothetical protein n=1 Tax=Pelagerythrobacter sp. TaxID=2800702 RepID=UPI0035B29A8F